MPRNEGSRRFRILAASKYGDFRMMRALRFGVAGLVALGFAGFLVCCVNYTKRVEFSLNTWAGLTTLDVYVSKRGVNFNPHGGNSDSYTFVFPAGQDHVPAAQIRQYFANYKEQVPPFAGTGGIDLKIDGGGCEIHVNLMTTDGQAFPANGTHQMRNCGVRRV